MTIKDLTLSAVFSKVAIAVATAGTVGGGAAIITAASVNAVQDQRLSTIEDALVEVGELNDNLHATRQEVALLRQALENDRASRDRRPR